MSRFQIRHALPEDKNEIIDFLNIYWGENHPLVNTPEFFNHYYLGEDGTLQFCLAVDEDGIAAVCGYIRASDITRPDIWLSILCARKDAKGAGLELVDKIKKLVSCRIIACNNIRESTLAFYSFLGFTALRLPHYYRLADSETYEVAQIKKKQILTPHGNNPLVRITSETQLAENYVPNDKLKPYKDLWYIKRRYFHYTMQQYDVYGILDSDKGNSFTGLLISRLVKVGNAFVLRIVDYIGMPDSFSEIGCSINKLMEQTGAEYADMYCYGIAEEIMNHAGFVLREKEDENIIPNYLNPPLYENTEYFFFTSDTDDFAMYKADGDQDRPNI